MAKHRNEPTGKIRRAFYGTEGLRAALDSIHRHGARRVSIGREKRRTGSWS